MIGNKVAPNASNVSWRFPDVEYLDLPIVLECDVVEPTGGCPCASRF